MRSPLLRGLGLQLAFEEPSNFVISPGSGKRPVSPLEKTFRPSTTTSKTPPEPATSVESTPKLVFSSAARLAALGW